MLDPKQERIAYVGDVHGLTTELKELIETVESEGDTFFVFLGDLVDKGPDSEGTVRLVKSLTEAGKGISICGNHDWKAWKKQSIVKSEEEWPARVPFPQDCLDFLGTLPPYVKVRNMLAVHGGLYPALFNSYETLPVPLNDWMTSKKKHQEHLRRLMFVRRIDERGHKTFNLEEPGTQWAELYDGREGFAFYGHEPYRMPKVDKYAIGLDTGAVFGLNLTAYVVTDDPRRGTFYYVKAKQKYCENPFEIK